VPAERVARDHHAELDPVARHGDGVGAVLDAADPVERELAHAHRHVEPKVGVLRRG